MSEPERPTKVRKTKRSDTVSKPDVTIEMAEPLPKKEEDDGAKNRTRQLNVEEVPFDFLTPQQKEELLKEYELAEEERRQKEFSEQQNSKKAKVLLGFIVGAGLGICAAYLVKKNLLGPVTEAALEAVSNATSE
jgi:hypothetical protein